MFLLYFRDRRLACKSFTYDEGWIRLINSDGTISSSYSHYSGPIRVETIESIKE